MTTWVLLRGLAREARHWEGFPALLEQQLAVGDEVVAIDLPGNGRRWRETSPLSVAGMVAAARAELRARGCRAPCVLLGLSLGGMVALEWARCAPAEVEALVLVNSSVGACSPFWQRLRPAAWGGLLRAWLPGSTWRRERAVHAMTSAQPVSEARVLQWVAYARSHPVSACNVLRQLLAAARYRAPASLSVPALVLVSLGDRLVAPACSHAIARRWNLPLREHPAAGHDLPLDDPRWVARQVTAWVGLRTD